MIKVRKRRGEKMIIKGLNTENNETKEKEWTIKEIQDELISGKMAVVLTKKVFIENKEFNLLLLTMGDDSIPYEREGSVYLPTFFDEKTLPSYIGEKNENNLIKATVKINKEDIIMFTMIKAEE